MWWFGRARRRKRRVQKLLQRDGRLCWLCTRPMLAGRETIEHLQAKAAGGTNDLQNLVLCHRGCNAHLKDRPLESKIRIRAKWHRAVGGREAVMPR